ncbi:peptidylprolyl isomerase [Haloferula sp.]|uniref:peptidylprolyl isomerase n=1 Tax=Haloferula sp. TaxID=2497595 RepID=UPI00329E3AA6
MLRNLSIAALIGAAISCSSEKSKDAEAHGQTATKASDFGNKVVLNTKLGDIVIELDSESAPISTANFLSYVEQGHYDATLFHRVIDGYLIEAGKFRAEGEGFSESPAGDPIESESRNGLRNKRGTLAMARTARPDSATSAFFINLGDNFALNHPQPDGHGYAVFGKVVSGMEIADQIGKVETGVSPLTLIHPITGELETHDVADVPSEPLRILSAKRIPK